MLSKLNHSSSYRPPQILVDQKKWSEMIRKIFVPPSMEHDKLPWQIVYNPDLHEDKKEEESPWSCYLPPKPFQVPVPVLPIEPVTLGSLITFISSGAMGPLGNLLIQKPTGIMDYLRNPTYPCPSLGPALGLPEYWGGIDERGLNKSDKGKGNSGDHRQTSKVANESKKNASKVKASSQPSSSKSATSVEKRNPLKPKKPAQTVVQVSIDVEGVPPKKVELFKKHGEDFEDLALSLQYDDEKDTIKMMCNWTQNLIALAPNLNSLEICWNSDCGVEEMDLEDKPQRIGLPKLPLLTSLIISSDESPVTNYFHLEEYFPQIEFLKLYECYLWKEEYHRTRGLFPKLQSLEILDVDFADKRTTSKLLNLLRTVDAPYLVSVQLTGPLYTNQDLVTENSEKFANAGVEVLNERDHRSLKWHTKRTFNESEVVKNYFDMCLIFYVPD